jgi:lysophospholipase L1-like esterase
VAAGFEVREEQTYAALLQKELTKKLGAPVQVINAAVRGYGTDQEYLQYRDRLRDLHPNLVILHLTGNDPEDNTTLHRARRPFGKPAFALRPDGSLQLRGEPVRGYPRCSAYRLNGDFEVTRIDSFADRALCWMESNLTDHSALFSFLAERIQTNPTLVRYFHGLGTPGEQEALVPAKSTRKPRPTTAPATTRVTAAPTTSVPAVAASTSSRPAPTTTLPPGQVEEPGVGTVLGRDYSRTLTSVLVVKLAAAVREDGSRLVLVTQQPDLAGLDWGAFLRAGMDLQLLDDALGSNFDAVHFANDGHLNARGHRKVADFLAGRIAQLLER